MAHKLVYDGLNVAIFLDAARMEEIALRQAAGCLSWQEQKSRFLKSRGELTPELTDEIHTFRRQAYEFVERKGLDERQVGRYLI